MPSSFGFSPDSSRPVEPEDSSGTAKTTPTPRARMRCAHSHQKIVLNPARSMSLLICRYSGICWYLANSSCHSAASSGGMTPWIGCHSVIDRPESVSRVAPPDHDQRKQHQQHDIEPAADQSAIAKQRGAAGRGGAALGRADHDSSSIADPVATGPTGGPCRRRWQDGPARDMPSRRAAAPLTRHPARPGCQAARQPL